jgi:hypothetical protein
LKIKPTAHRVVEAADAKLESHAEKKARRSP